MSLRRYLPQQKSQPKKQLRALQQSYNEEYNTEEPTVGASTATSLTMVVPAEVPSSTATPVIPSRSATTTEAPPVTDQIANLLNLAQHLLSSVREQQQQQQQHRHRHRYHHRREARLQERTPYQRPNSDLLLRATQRHNESGNDAFRNVNTVSIGETCAVTNGAANSVILQQSLHTEPRHFGSNINNCNSGAGEDNINFQCSICLDSYLLHRPMVTQCGHLFCKRCIRQCVNCQGKCPMCNRKLNSNSIFRVYF